MEDGAAVIPVDQVHMAIFLDGQSKAFHESTVPFDRRSIVAEGVPVGARWTMVLSGFKRSADDRRWITWWEGTSSGVATTDRGRVRMDTTLLKVQDTSAPAFANPNGFPNSAFEVLPSGTTERTVSFQVAATDSVFRTDAQGKQDTLLPLQAAHSLVIAVPAVVHLKIVDPSGNATLRTLDFRVAVPDAEPTIAIVSPSRDTTLTSQVDSFLITVDPAYAGQGGIDSVVIGGKSLTTSPWSTKVALTPGENIVSASVRAGTKRATASRLITLPRLSGGETDDPVVARSSGMPTPDDKDSLPWSTKSIALSWSVSDASPLTVTLDGEPLTRTEGDLFGTVRPLVVGANEFRLLAKDSLGNTTSDLVKVFRKQDQEPPTVVRIRMDTLNRLPFATSSFPASWSVKDNDGVASVDVDGQSAKAEANDVWSLGIVLPKRPNGLDTIVRLAARDRSGNIARDSLRIVVASDTSAPVIRRGAGTRNDVFPSGTTSVPVEWTVKDLGGIASVTINGEKATSLDSVFEGTIAISQDTTKVTLVATDSAGNLARDSVFLYLAEPVGDTIPPTVTRGSQMPIGKLPSTVPWIVKEFTFSWNIRDEGTILSANLGNNGLMTAGGGIWTRTQAIPVGTTTFELIVKDQSSNETRDTVVIVRLADTSKPIIRGMRNFILPFGSRSLDTSLTITDLDTVRLVTLGGVVTPLKDSSLPVRIGLRKDATGYDTTVVVRVEDRAGNSTTDTIRIALRPDSIAPTLQRVIPTEDTLLAENASEFTLRWISADNDSLVSVTCNGVAVTGVEGLYQHTLQLLQDTTKVVLKSTDRRGNLTKDSILVTRRPDETPPSVDRIKPSGATVDVPRSNRAVPFSWNIVDAGGLDRVTINGEPFAQTAPGGVYDTTIQLLQDSLKVTLVAVDRKGNTKKDSLTLRLERDTEKPVLIRRSPSRRDTTLPASETSFPVSWEVKDNVAVASVSIDGKPVTGIVGIFSSSITLDGDTTRVIAIASDAAGNSTSDTITLLRPPAVSVVESAPGWASQGSGTSGGAGGLVDTVTTMTDFRIVATSPEPRIIFIKGTIGTLGTHGNLDADVVAPASNKTILGLPGAVFQGSLNIKNSNIIVRNLVIEGSGGADVAGYDAISINGATARNIWIDHCDIRDPQDGAIDITKAANFVTISRTRFSNSDRTKFGWYAHLVGSSNNEAATDSLALKTTFYQNWWTESIRERIPRVRFGQVHIVNNLYMPDGTNSTHAIRSAIGSNILVQANLFLATNNPVEHFDPVTNPGQRVRVTTDNLFEATTGTTVGVNENQVFTPPYSLPILDPSKLESILKDPVTGAGATISRWKL